MRLMLAGKGHTPKGQGGACELPGERCFDRPGVWVDLSERWQDFEYPYCRFWPEGWGDIEAPLDPSQLVSLHGRVSAGRDFELWMDDLAFFKAKRGEKQACDRPCPADAAPPSANLDARLTRAQLTESLTLSTFEQPTARCGAIVRRYLSYVPKRLGKKSKAPVVFMLHGTGANAESSHWLMTRGHFTELAERDGFVVVYGNAAPGAATDPSPDFPNTGAWRHAFADDGQVDDVDYLLRVVDDLVRREIIAGGNPVFLSGLSNGGGMVLEAGRKAPQRFRGIAALMPFDGRHPAPPPDLQGSNLRRVLFVYSRADPGLVEGYGSVLDSLPPAWARALGLPDATIDKPATRALVDRVEEGAHYEGDNAVALATRASTGRQLDMADPATAGKVRVIVFDHAGHFWPTPVQDKQPWILNRWGFRNQDIDASDAVWEFFRSAL
jgi:poly(3-hydroxybutyrate) depolymerase